MTGCWPCAQPGRSAGCRTWNRSPPHSTTASSPSRNRSSRVKVRGRSLSTRASSSNAPVLEPPSLAPTKVKSRKSFVSKWLARMMRSGREPGRVATTLAIATVPSGVRASNGCSVALIPIAPSVEMMYWRVATLAGVPDTRGPISTNSRMCSYARWLSKPAGGACVAAAQLTANNVIVSGYRISEKPADEQEITKDLAFPHPRSCLRRSFAGSCFYGRCCIGT